MARQARPAQPWILGGQPSTEREHRLDVMSLPQVLEIVLAAWDARLRGRPSWWRFIVNNVDVSVGLRQRRCRSKRDVDAAVQVAEDAEAWLRRQLEGLGKDPS